MATEKLKTVAIIQARMGSTRLPGKVMMSLCGKTVLSHVIERVSSCSLLDEVIVATTTSSSDDAIVKESKMFGAKVFRGSEEDVLSRYYHAAKESQADIVVRVTSDCPLFDPDILSKMLNIFLDRTQTSNSADYYSNALQPTFPLGLSAEIFTFKALERSFFEARKDYEREHVTPYMYLHPEIFKCDCLTNKTNLSHYRWTLDTAEDFHLINEIYNHVYEKGKLFGTEVVQQLLKEKPELSAINAHVRQKQLGE